MFISCFRYAMANAVLCLVFNLIIRAIWWSEKPLLSWNVPLSLVLGYLTGFAVWHAMNASNRRYAARLNALRNRHEEMNDLINQAWVATSDRQYNEAMAKVEAFLNHPETGVEIKRKPHLNQVERAMNPKMNEEK